MRLKTITELDPAPGRVKRPWRSRNHKFVLSDRTIDPQRPLASALIEVDSYTEALDLMGRGHAIYMSDGGSEPVLIPPCQLRLRDQPYSRIDDLWIYTMPRAPFRLKALEDDIVLTMASLARVLGLIANDDVAHALVDASSGGLAGLRIAAILRAAYHSAFRSGPDRALTDEEFHQLEAVRKFLLVIGPDGGNRDYEQPFSPLHHTIYCAYLRHKLASNDIADVDLDQPFTKCLSALAGIGYEAARNSLAKAGISTVRDRLSHGEIVGEIVGWLEKRRDFAPLRACERPRFRATMAALEHLHTLPCQHAFAQIRASQGSGPIGGIGTAYELCRAEDDMAEAITRQHDVPCDVLRRYAQSLNLCIDSFVDGFRPLDALAVTVEL